MYWLDLVYVYGRRVENKELFKLERWYKKVLQDNKQLLEVPN